MNRSSFAHVTRPSRPNRTVTQPPCSQRPERDNATSTSDHHSRDPSRIDMDIDRRSGAQRNDHRHRDGYRTLRAGRCPNRCAASRSGNGHGSGRSLHRHQRQSRRGERHGFLRGPGAAHEDVDCFCGRSGPRRRGAAGSRGSGGTDCTGRTAARRGHSAQRAAYRREHCSSTAGRGHHEPAEHQRR